MTPKAYYAGYLSCNDYSVLQSTLIVINLTKYNGLAQDIRYNYPTRSTQQSNIGL